MRKIACMLGAMVVFALLFGCISPGPIPSGVDAQGRQYRGAADAKVTIVEFSDFQCPFCAEAEPVVQQLLREYGGKVKLIYRHYPLPEHQNAQKAAEAAECAADQGKFWEMHDAMYANQQLLDSAGLQKLAGGAGLGMQEFSACLQSGKKAGKIASDVFEGGRFGVRATPTFFVDGIGIEGGSYEKLKKQIEAGIAR